MFDKIENRVHKTLVCAAIIIVGGFVLFNLAFMLAAALVLGLNALLRLGLNAQPPTVYSLLVFIVLLMVGTYFVFRSQWDDLIKATFLTMPLMSLFVVLGVALYQLPQFVLFALGAGIVGALCVTFYLRKMPWLYYFAVAYVAALALWIVLAGIEI